MPFEDCIYFGDTKNMPYGEKSKEQLIEFSYKIFKFFEKQNVKAVVMACNTTSSQAYEALKDKFNFKIYPVTQSVTNVLAKLPIERIGVFATHATINSHAYANGIKKLNPHMTVTEMACPDWVRIVEDKTGDTPQSIEKIKSKMDEMLLYKPQKIVLGCTHYPYLLEQLKTFADVDTFINPAISFVQFIKEDLAKSGLLTDKTTSGYEEFYVSAAAKSFQEAGSMFYEIKSLPEIINL